MPKLTSTRAPRIDAEMLSFMKIQANMTPKSGHKKLNDAIDAGG